MKKTLLLLVALFTMGGVTLNAQEKVYADFSECAKVQGNLTWNGDDSEYQYFTWSLSWSNQLHGIKFGDMKLPYGDITMYEKLVIDCTIESGDGYRFMFYSSKKGTTAGGTTIVTKSGKNEYNLSDIVMDADYLKYCDDISLSGYNGSGKVKVNEMYLVKSSDPLAGDKKILSEKIAFAKQQNSYVKTIESFAALTDEIDKAEAALADVAATKASLTKAMSDLDAAISGLALQAGYTNLTAAMFKQHETFGGAEMGTAGCAYDVFKSTGMPYGDGSVGWLNYADLSGYDKLIVVATAGKPRFCMNRLEAGGQQAETQAASKMLDINPNNAYTWSTEKYQTVESGVYIVDLKEIVKDYGFAYLHSIKGANFSDVTVSDMLLYKDPTVTLTSSAELEGYKTFYNKTDNYEVDAKTTIYKASAASTTSVTLEAVAGNIVPKNTPVVLKTTAADYKITLSPTTATATGDFTGNQLYAAEAEAKNAYILAYTTADGLGFFKYTDALEAGHVCVTVPALAPVRLSLDVDGEATAISEVATKVAEEGAAYNLAGQPVDADYKGIVIKNGKKFLQK